MTEEKRKVQALRLYLILSGVFIAGLVASNLIFKKFFSYYSWSSPEQNLVVSVGIIAYPITFLVTDLVSELYGRQKAQALVLSGLVVSLFVVVLVYAADSVTAIDGSPVNDSTFKTVFGNTPAAIISSMVAYLLAQFIDVRIFHFWKRYTKGKYLWLRNNLSTIPSQIIDTSVVLLVLCYAGEIEWQKYWPYLMAGVIFKSIVALIDTPVLYLLVYYARKHFRLTGPEDVIQL